MTLARCPSHGRPLRDATLCADCVDSLERDLGDLGALTDELTTMLVRQDRVARPSRLTRSDDDGLPLTARVQPLPFDEGAGVALTEIRNTLVGWVRILHGDQPPHGPVHLRCRHASCTAIRRQGWPEDELPAMARWLLVRVPAIRVHAGGRELADDIGGLVESARKIVDLMPDLWFAGVCSAQRPGFEPCPEWLYAEMRSGVMDCPRCGATHDVADRRRELLTAADDQLETATHLAQALTRLGEPVTAERIRKWRERGRLTEHGCDSDGHPMYRVGDVIKLLDQDRERAERRTG